MESQNTNTKLLHKWTIEYYNFIFFKGRQSPSFFQSDSFSAPNIGKTFFLRLYPKGFNSENGEHHSNEHMSLFLHLQEGTSVNVDYRFSIVKIDGTMEQFPRTEDDKPTEETKGTLTENTHLGFSKYIQSNPNYLCFNGYLDKKSNLTIICELEILDQISSEVSRSKIVESKTISDADIAVLSHEYKWNIEQFQSLKHFVFSEDFHIGNLETLKFHFRLWPKGRQTREESKDHVALYLNRGYCADQRNHTAQSRVSIVDVQNKNRNQKWIHGKLIGSNGFGCDQYIDYKFLTDKAHELLPDNFLKINCEIELLYKENRLDKNESSISNNSAVNRIKDGNCIITNSVVLMGSKGNIGNVQISSQ